MSDVDVKQTSDATDTGDSDEFAHYVEKDDIMEAFVYGTPVIALCGKVWVPSRDGAGFPTCPRCEEVYSILSLLSSHKSDEV